MTQSSNIVIEAADLFCGAGGTSSGILLAGKDLKANVNLLAINHWTTAVNTHSLNHPGVRHKCETLETIRPIDVVPSGRLHFLAASPECQGHSIAAGGMTRNDQSRATAWHVARWATELTIDNIMIENVKEFLDWGPLHPDHSNGCKANHLKGEKCTTTKCHFGKPIKERKGEFFRAWKGTFLALGYSFEYKIQCAADFGDPTSRKRLIILMRRDGKPIKWPEPTHGPGRKYPYRTARECIDWGLKGQSIFNRKRPLSKNTLRRIAAGLKKYGGKHAQPFLVKLYGTNTTASIDEPMPTVTAGGNHLAVAEAQPFVMHTNHAGGDRCHDLNNPLPTVTAAHRGEMALVEPFICGVTHGQRENNHRSVDSPLPTITTAKGGEFTLVEPFIAQFNGMSKCHTVDNPLNTVTTKERFCLVEPFVLGQQSGATPRSVDQPLPTVATAGAIALVEPFLIGQGGPTYSAKPKSVNEPLNTVMTDNHMALVEPFLVSAGGPNVEAIPVSKPMNTVLTRDHMALVEPFIVGAGGPARAGEPRPVDKPMNTIMTRNTHALVEPFVAKYYGTGVTQPVTEPLDTVTTKDRFLLVEPDTNPTRIEYDIRIRMLQPHELQAAMSFPKTYQFIGSKADKTRQIGNAVPVQLARAHALALLQDMVE